MRRDPLILVLMASVALPAAAHAQQSSQRAALEEIVVTARKRSESIFEIPVSVSAMTGAALAQAGITTGQDMSDLIPGLDFRQVGFVGLDNNMRFRGMIQQIITPSTQIGALFWDGSYIGGGGGFLPLGDMERVEVIKGPQTAYFGRNTFAGAVNYIPKMPGDTWEGNIVAQWSPTEHDKFNVNAGVGGPVTEKFGIRVWGGYNRTGGNLSFGDGEPFGQITYKSMTSTMTLNPSDSVRLKLTGYYTYETDTSLGVGSPATTPAGGCGLIYRGQQIDVVTGALTPYTADLSKLTIGGFCGEFPSSPVYTTPYSRYPQPNKIFGGQARFDAMTKLDPNAAAYGIIPTPKGGFGGWAQTYRIQGSGDFDVGNHTVSFIASQANTGSTSIVDFFYGIPFTGTDPQLTYPIGTSTAILERYGEGRFSSPQDQRLRYLAGVTYYWQRYSSFPDASVANTSVDYQKSTTFAVFGSFDYDFTDDLTLSVEARYSKDKFNAIKFGNPNLPCTNPALVCDQTDKLNAFIPRVIVKYRPMDGATAYASFSQSKLLGLATQAAYINSIAPTVITADAVAKFGIFTPPQRNTQYEIGWKQQWDDWSMTLAIYKIDWKNQPFPAVIFLPTGGTSSFRGPGDSKYSGFDLEVSGLVTDWLSFTSGLAYNNGVMVNYSNYGSNESAELLAPGPLASNGFPVRDNPEWSGSLSPVVFGTWRDHDWSIRIDYIYTGKFYVDYSKYLLNPSASRVNLNAGIDLTTNLRFETYGTNIFNNKTAPSTSGTTTAIGARKMFTGVPQFREFGVRVKANF
ncbi:MAG: TonB-dependent receptor [Rhodobacteraceae bacterium]|nr:TonB-dependent receptor [Paracoccaceae bacterium]